MTKESRNEGKWWTLHNLGIVYSKLPNTFPDKFISAECSYKKALNVLGENLDVRGCRMTQSQNSSRYFLQPVSYQNSEEIKRNKVTTLRRLAQFYREQAENAANEGEAFNLNSLAVNNYNQLLGILPQEITFQKEPVYPADVSVELADALSDLDKYDEAAKLYESAAKIYQEQKDFASQVLTLQKWSDAALRGMKDQEAIEQLEKAILIQENEMNLSPVNDEIAANYSDLANIYNNHPIPTEDTLKYNNLSRVINNLSFNDTKSISRVGSLDTSRLFADFENLADAYIKINKCNRAEQVYIYAVSTLHQSDKPSMEEIHFMSKLGQFYYEVQRDNKKARIKFDEFVEAYKSFPLRLGMILQAETNTK